MHLLACDSCRRQLNVSALQPGDPVRCVCGAILVVGSPRDVVVRGLCCSRCGGRVGPEDRACAFCQAALDEDDRRESLLCPGCFTRLPGDSGFCKACGIRLHARALPALPRSGSCPACQGGLRVWVGDELELVECAACGGLWCDHGAFDGLRERAARGPAELDLGVLGRPGVVREVQDEGPRSPYVPCIHCGQLMQRRQFRVGSRPSRVVLDFCGQHGTWFDPDELTQVLRFVAEQGQAGAWRMPRQAARPEPGEASLPARDSALDRGSHAWPVALSRVLMQVVGWVR